MKRHRAGSSEGVRLLARGLALLHLRLHFLQHLLHAAQLCGARLQAVGRAARGASWRRTGAVVRGEARRLLTSSSFSRISFSVSARGSMGSMGSGISVVLRRESLLGGEKRDRNQGRDRGCVGHDPEAGPGRGSDSGRWALVLEVRAGSKLGGERLWGKIWRVKAGSRKHPSQRRLSPAAGPIAGPRPGQALQAAGPVALVEQVVRHLLQILQVRLHQHPSQVQEIAVMWVLHWGTDRSIRKLPVQAHPLGKVFQKSYPSAGEGHALQLKDLSLGS